jgi:dihydrofolate reductase
MKNSPALVLVVAVGENGVIGRNGALPWKIPGDLKRFQQLTMGKPIIMGRLTFESMGGPLKGRLNIVITTNPNYKAEGAAVVTSLKDALALAEKEALRENTGEIAVIGGSIVFAETLPLAAKLEITEVHGAPEGDTFFPPFGKSEWKETLRDGPHQGPKDSLPYTFVTYERAGR